MFARGTSVSFQRLLLRHADFELVTWNTWTAFQPRVASLVCVCVRYCVLRNKLSFNGSPYSVGIIAGDEKEAVHGAVSIMPRDNAEETRVFIS